jgi:hypothetical protein
MEAIVFALGKGDTVAKIGQTQETKDWFGIPEELRGQVVKGDKCDFTFEGTGWDKKIATYKKLGTVPQTYQKSATGSSNGYQQRDDKWIAAQSIGHMVSRTINAFQGTVDINNAKETIAQLFDIYADNVKRVHKTL